MGERSTRSRDDERGASRSLSAVASVADLNLVCEDGLPGQTQDPGAGGLPPPTLAPKVGGLVLGRYRVMEVLGEGGWCRVSRAADVQSSLGAGQVPQVALKTYRDQALRESGEAGLSERFAREVATFKALGLSHLHDSLGTPAPSGVGAPRIFARSRSGGLQVNPRDLFVNLLGYSRAAGHDLTPGAAPDSRFYSVLELGGDSLESFLDRRASAHTSLACGRCARLLGRWPPASGGCMIGA